MSVPAPPPAVVPVLEPLGVLGLGLAMGAIGLRSSRRKRGDRA